MTLNREEFVRVFLRPVGSVAALAAFCAVMPYSWMNATPGFVPCYILWLSRAVKDRG